MAKYLPTISTDAPETVRAQPGQWISYQGARGRYMGVSRAGNVWIAWADTARKRFAKFARVFNEG